MIITKKIKRNILSFLIFSLAAIAVSEIANAQSELNIEVGIETEGQRDLNTAVIPYFEYHGQCPGTAYGSIRGWFTSSKSTPGDHRRVIIRNVTRGLSPEKPPYTDREYFQGRASEGFDINFGNKHNNRLFIVLDGINTLEYEIRDKDTVIERGSFEANVVPSETIQEERNRIRKTKNIPVKYQEWNEKRQRYVTKTRYEEEVYYDCP